MDYLKVIIAIQTLFNTISISLFLIAFCLLYDMIDLYVQTKISKNYHLFTVDSARINNPVNVTIFSKKLLVTYKNTQVNAYYGRDAHRVLDYRKLVATPWRLQRTCCKRNAANVSNVMSVIAEIKTIKSL